MRLDPRFLPFSSEIAVQPSVLGNDARKLVGTPVRFIFKEGENPYEGRRNVLTERQVAKKKRLIRHVKRGK